MTDLLQTDARAYRTCILYEALRKTPIEEAFENMKELVPNADYFDYQYWFYRFFNGNYDLDHDRSTDTKIYGMSDMPVEVIDKIVRKLNLVDKLITRKVSKMFRAVIDQQKAEFDGINIGVGKNSFKIEFENKLIKYIAKENGKCVLVVPHSRRVNGLWRSSKREVHRNDRTLELAMKDLSILFGNKNWKFDKIEINFNADTSLNWHFRQLHFGYPSKNDINGGIELSNESAKIGLMKSLLCTSETHVEHLKICSRTVEPMVTLLPYFNPNSLKIIHFDCDEIDRILIGKLMKMDQWKNAEILMLRSVPHWFPIENLFHARRIEISRVDMNEERLVKIRDILFKSPTFEYFRWCFHSFQLEFHYEDEDYQEFDLDDINRVMGAHSAYDARNEQYHIEGSNEYFDITVARYDQEGTVTIEKKRRRHFN